MPETHGTNGTNGDHAPTLPQPNLTEIAPGIALLEPLSRKGTGPGLIVLPHASIKQEQRLAIDDGVPSPLMKWAEEGYTVVELREEALNTPKALRTALEALKECPKCDQADAIGVVAYDASLYNRIVAQLQDTSAVVGVVVYAEAAASEKLIKCPVPVLQHLGGRATQQLPRTSDLKAYDYPTMKSSLFATPFQADFHYSTDMVAHTRCLTFLKPLMKGPYFDLEAIWEEHCLYEFGERDVPKTMSTMVQEPYVNHVPTLTGGVGRGPLTHFYQNHFVFSNPDDIELEVTSRTVGIDRIIDEFVAKFTHTRVVDWLLPGVPPTGKKLEIPFTSVVNVRGDRLYYEHIAWDQATTLVQLGLLPEYLPWTLPLPDGRKPGPGKRFEYRVPAAGIEAAQKLRDRNAAESNKMFEYDLREVDV